MAITAAAFTFVSFKSFGSMRMVFHVLAIALWAGLSVIHGAGFEVSATEVNLIYNETNDLIFNETKSKIMIPGEEDAYWLGYLFMGFAVGNLFLLFKTEVFKF